MLVTISITIAWLYSIVATALQLARTSFDEEPFFETVALLVVLIYIGKVIQAVTRRSLGFLDEDAHLVPASALLINPKHPDQANEIDSRLLQLGDTLRVLPGAGIPTDGIVFAGSSEVDEAALTGESLPVRKVPGSSVAAGTRNISSQLDIALGALPRDSTIARMAAVVSAAQNSRPPIQAWIDKLASAILPCAMAASALAFFIWSLVGVYIRFETSGKAVIDAFTYAIAILIVSCPCALGLAVRRSQPVS